MLQVTSGGNPVVLGWGKIAPAGWITSSGVKEEPDSSNTDDIGLLHSQLFTPYDVGAMSAAMGQPPAVGRAMLDNYVYATVMPAVFDLVKRADGFIRGAVGKLRFSVAQAKIANSKTK